MNTTVPQPALVTGASGFIGGRLVRRLIERGCPVTCLVRHDSRVDDLRSLGATLVTGDVTDRGSVERALVQSQAALVFHVAGLVRARRRDDFMRVNVGGVETVAAACADRAAPPVLTAVSSLAAAGPCGAAHARGESEDPSPVSDYGRSKLAGERVAARFAGAVPITVVRPPIVFGPGDRAVFEMFRPIARWGLHVVPARRGEDRRLSLIHVDDLVEGLVLAAQKGERLPPHGSVPSDGRGIYFLAADDRPTYAQLGRLIATAVGAKPPTVIRLPAPLLRIVGLMADAAAKIRGRPGWISSDKITEALAGSWACSSAKAHTQLGWSPAAPLPERLRETAGWYRDARWL